MRLDSLSIEEFALKGTLQEFIVLLLALFIIIYSFLLIQMVS